MEATIIKKFEYKTFKEGLSDEELKELGLNGWELVSHSVVLYQPVNRLAQYYVFKRELISYL